MELDAPGGMLIPVVQANVWLDCPKEALAICGTPLAPTLVNAEIRSNRRLRAHLSRKMCLQIVQRLESMLGQGGTRVKRLAQFTEPLDLLRCVSRWTSGRVKDLQVRINGQQVVLAGSSDTYYAKQLAQHGVLELIPSAEIQNSIEVR